MTRIQYTGDFACSTIQPSVDWKPGEVKDLSAADAEALSSNELFVVAPVAVLKGAPVTVTVPIPTETP